MRTLRIVIFYLVPVTGATSWLFRVARSALDSAAASARSSCRRDREHRRHVCRYSVRFEGSEACPRRYSQTLQPFPEQRRDVNGESNVRSEERRVGKESRSRW